MTETKVYNGLLDPYLVEVEEQPDGSLRQVIKVAETTGGGGSGVDPVGLKNIAAAAIDPATEDKQDDAIALLTTIESNQLPDGHNVTVDNASIAVTAASLPLPTGAATEATLSSIDTDTSSMSADLSDLAGTVTGTSLRITTSGPLAVTQSGTWNLNNITGNISLPTGASTSALQSTGNSTLSTISTTVNVPTSVSQGSASVVTPSTAVVLGSSLTIKEIHISASDTNTTFVSLGGSGVTTSNGMVLYPGGTVKLRISNRNLLYVNASATATVRYTTFS